MATLQPNEQVGPYRIVEQVGAGGVAVVYKALDPLLNRHVAIKHIANADKDDRRQLRDEAQAAKKLTALGPSNLVRLIDTINDPRGLMIVSEFVEGESLERILARDPKPMEPARGIELLRKIARGLEQIHQHNVLHRDVKPANILVGEDDTIKLTDFGLAVAMAEQQVMDAGSVRYMAPELLRGEKADARADLYSLGMIGYELLAGRAKFDEVFAMVLRDQRNAAMRWMKWHTNPRTTAPPLAEQCPGLPPNVAGLIDRLLAKDPQARIESAAQFIAALDRNKHAPPPLPKSAQQQNFTTPQTTAGGDTAPLPTTTRGLKPLIASFAVLVAVSVGLGANLYRVYQIKEQKAQAQFEETIATAKTALQDGNYTEAQGEYQRIVERWPGASPEGHAARLGLLEARGRSHLEAGRYNEALYAFNDAIDLDPDADFDDLIDRAKQGRAFQDALQQISAAIERGQFNNANKKIREWELLLESPEEQTQLRAVREKLADRRMTSQATDAMQRAQTLIDQGRRSEALDLLDKTVARHGSYRPLREMFEEVSNNEIYETSFREAEAAQEAGEYAEALEAYQRAAAARPSDELTATIEKLESELLLDEGMALFQNNRIAEAERYFVLALGKNPSNERAKEALGKIESANRMQVFIDAGDAAVIDGDYAAGINQYENALALGSNDRVTAKLLDARVRKLLEEAVTTLETGDVNGAFALIAKAKQIDPDHPKIAPIQADIARRGEYFRYLRQGDEARDRGEFSDAKRAYRRAMDVSDTPEVRERMDDTEYAHLLAQAAAAIDQEDYLSAKAWLRIAYQRRQSEQVAKMLEAVLQYEPDRPKPLP